MQVSIITPTSERQDYLPLLYDVICRQRFEGEWEWLICDDSLRPNAFLKNLNDPRVRYYHTEEFLSIGEKRNLLIEQARGEWIFHFDDDDYYAPSYIAKVLEIAKEADFFTLSAWFCYESFTKGYYYWQSDSIHTAHYFLSPLQPGQVRHLTFDPTAQEQEFIEKYLYGFGFSYAYRRSLFKKVHFAPMNLGEDYDFCEQARAKGAKVALHADVEGLILHILHDMNTSSIFPQYALPAFCGEKFFPHAGNYLKNYPSVVEVLSEGLDRSLFST